MRKIILKKTKQKVQKKKNMLSIHLNNMYAKFIMIYSIILIIIVLGMVICTGFSKKFNKDLIQKLSTQSLNESQQFTKQTMNMIEMYMFNIAADGLLNVPCEELSIEDMMYLAHNFFSRHNTADCVKSTYIYYEATGKVITSDRGVLSVGEMMELHWLDKYNKTISQETKTSRIILYPHENAEGVLSLMCRFPFYGQKKLGTVVVNIDVSELFFYKEKYSQIVGSRLVLNSDGELIWGDKALYAALGEKNISVGEDRISTQKCNGKKYFVTSIYTDEYGWQYMLLQGYGEFYGKMNTMWIIYGIVFLCVLIAGSYIFIKLLKKTYAPISDMFLAARGHYSDGKAFVAYDEVKLLRQITDSLASGDKKFKRVDAPDGFTLQSILLNLCYGRCSKSDEEYLLDQLAAVGFHFKDCFFSAIVIQIEKNQEGKEPIAVSEHFSFEQYNTEILITGIMGKKMVGLVSFSESESELVTILDKFRCMLDKEYGIVSSIGVGNVCHSLREYSRSFAEAKSVLEYKKMESSESVVHINEYLPCNTIPKYFYPEEKEQNLIRALHLSNEEQAKEIVNDIFTSINLASNQTEYVKKMFWQVYSSMQRAVDSLGFEFEKVVGKNAVEEIELYNQFDEVREIYHFMIKRIEIIVDYIRENRRYSSEVVVKKIVDYIDENYSQDLSLNTMADFVKLSPNYVSKLFKETIGQGLKDYVREVRMKKAAELILSTDLSFEVLSKQVGFESSRTFYRNFSIYYNMTPNEYRTKNSSDIK